MEQSAETTCLSRSSLTTRRASALAFLIASSALALQLLIFRIVSAKLLNNYAFLVISLTMLGFAVSGVFLTAFPRLASQRLPETHARQRLPSWFVGRDVNRDVHVFDRSH